MSMINQKQVLSLQQKLSPQQIQMIKLLELPTMQLEPVSYTHLTLPTT